VRIENQQVNIALDKKRADVPAKPRTSFHQVLHTAERQVRSETLVNLMEEIEETGERLTEERTLKLLGRYKRLVKQFLEEAIKNGLAWTSQESHFHGRFKMHHLIKTVDERLMQMTADLLEDEEGHLRLLALVGEIKGLLVELYA
jgi:uncharacterized protein